MSRSATSGTPAPTASASAGPSSSRATPVEPATDLYRPLAAQITRSIAPLASASGPSGLSNTAATTPSGAGGAASTPAAASLAALLGLDAPTYAARLSGKTLLLTDTPQGEPSALVTGRKRNRGDARALAATKAAQAADAAKRQQRGVRSVRKAVVGRCTVVDYAALLPLHYLHMAYIAQVLGLPPCPGDYSAPLPVPGEASAASGANTTATTPSTHPSTPSSTPRHPGGAGVPLRGIPGLSPDVLLSKLLKADFTGAQLRVVGSRNASLLGARGIVIEETAGSFRLAGEDGRVRVVPKVGSQFKLDVPAYAPPRAPSVGDGAGAGADSMAGVGSGGDPAVVSRDDAHDADDEAGASSPSSLPNYPLFTAHAPRITTTLLGSAFAFRSGDRAGRKFRPAQGDEGSGWAHDWVRGEWSFLNDLGEAEPDLRARRRKRGKSRRKDPVAHGAVQVW